MGITKVLAKSAVAAGKKVYDVLIPLPANADVCLKSIGIEEFGDADETWDADFCRILRTLIGNEPYSVAAVDPATGEIEPIASATIADLQEFLAYCDHINFVITVGDSSITFTHGHEILWLSGFSKLAIMSLPYHIETVENERIGELF
jgi:hypothetical protein